MQAAILLAVLLVSFHAVVLGKPRRGYVKFPEPIETVDQPLPGMYAVYEPCTYHPVSLL